MWIVLVVLFLLWIFWFKGIASSQTNSSDLQYLNTAYRQQALQFLDFYKNFLPKTHKSKLILTSTYIGLELDDIDFAATVEVALKYDTRMYDDTGSFFFTANSTHIILGGEAGIKKFKNLGLCVKLKHFSGISYPIPIITKNIRPPVSLNILENYAKLLECEYKRRYQEDIHLNVFLDY